MEHQTIFELIPDSGRITAERAAEIAASHWGIFEEFFTMALEDDNVWGQRASRVTNFACIINPEFYGRICQRLIFAVEDVNSASVLRNFLKTILDSPLPTNEEELGSVVSSCFRILEKGPWYPGVQVYAMSLLAKVGELYPDLEDELSIILVSRLDDESAGIRCRASQILKQIRKSQRI